MSTATYTLGVVCQDMAPAEALYQAFDNLAHLNEVVNDVFGRLTTRIAAERAKVSQVVKRVQEAQIKATRISENQTKVTTIHSPAKYPAPKQLNDFQRVFDGQFEESRLSAPRRSEYNLTAKQRRAEAQGVDTSEIFSSLSKARATRQDPDRRVAEAGVGAEGLGRLPAYLPSVSSVLLFNSDENPYKKYVSFNNLEGTAGTDRQQQQTGLAAAPKTIFEGTGLPTFAALQYEYKPDLGQVPTFALPQNLPLGKLADISFGADGVASIAPSIAQLPSLPTIESFQKSAATPAKKQAAPNPSQPPAQPSSIPIAPAAAAAVAPPLAPPMHVSPPGPPQMPTTLLGSPVPDPPSSSSSHDHLNMNMNMSKSEAPPIAPPLLPSASTDDPGPGAPDKTGPNTNTSVPSDSSGGGGRQDLMAAIRDRGNLTRLRKADDREERPGKPVAANNKKAKAPPPMDMMAALKERLARRHTVISGKIDKETKVDPAEVMPHGMPAPKPGARVNLPRLGGDNKEGERKRQTTKTKTAAVSPGETDDSEGPGSRDKPGMSDAVMQAYMEAHAKKQGKDDPWD